MLRRTWAALLGAAMGWSAQAQPGAVLYGLIDTTVRYSTHAGPGGGRLSQVSEGVLSGSRWGLRGAEALGGGMTVEFVLESGFSPDTGRQQQGGRLFGRQSTLGLSGAFGRVTVGRQFTLVQDIVGSYEASGLGNLLSLGYQGVGYTGLRQDNMVKYVATLAGTELSASHTFGEQAGSWRDGASHAVGLGRRFGDLRVAGVYQVRRGVADYFGTPVAASRQLTWSAGATYDWRDTRGYLGFTRSGLDGAGYRNQAVYAGFRQAFGASWKLIGTVTYDRLRHAGGNGARLGGGLLLDRALSRRTGLYLALDYTRLRGGWMTAATLPGFATPFFAGHRNQAGVTIGLRHAF